MNKSGSVVLAILSFAWLSAIEAAVLFGHDNNNDLFRVDTTTQSLTSVSTGIVGPDIEMTADQTNVYFAYYDQMYIVDSTTGLSTGPVNLTNFPPATDSVTALERVNNTLYAAVSQSNVKDQPGVFGIVDPVSGLITSLGTMAGMGAPTGGLHYVRGKMYAISSANAVDASLFSIDFATGEASLIAPVTLSGTPVRNATGLTYADGKMFLVKQSDTNLYSIDLDTGVLTLEFDLGVQLISLTTVREANSNQISIENGFIKLDTTGGYEPQNIDCSDPTHYGRMVLDETGIGNIWICAEAGWRDM